MTNKYKTQMIALPILKVVMLFVLVIGVLNLFPYIVQSGLGSIKLGGSSIGPINVPSIPALLQIVVAVAVSLPLIAKGVKSVSSYRNWQSGNSPACPECSGPMIQRKVGYCWNHIDMEVQFRKANDHDGFKREGI
jgi:hypothetical protein